MFKYFVAIFILINSVWGDKSTISPQDSKEWQEFSRKMRDKYNDYRKRYDKDNQKFIKEITNEITEKAKILRARIKKRHQNDTRVDYFFKLEEDLKKEFLKEDAPEDTLDIDDLKSLDEIKDQIEERKDQYRKLYPRKKENGVVAVNPDKKNEPIPKRDDVVLIHLGGEKSAHESNIKINGVEIKKTNNESIALEHKSSKLYIVVLIIKNKNFRLF